MNGEWWSCFFNFLARWFQDFWYMVVDCHISSINWQYPLLLLVQEPDKKTFDLMEILSNGCFWGITLEKFGSSSWSEYRVTWFSSTKIIWEMKKTWWFRVWKGLYYPVVWGLIKIDKDPYLTTSIMETKGFFRRSLRMIRFLGSFSPHFDQISSGTQEDSAQSSRGSSWVFLTVISLGPRPRGCMYGINEVYLRFVYIYVIIMYTNRKYTSFVPYSCISAFTP